jgi:condensin complex subunit 1
MAAPLFPQLLKHYAEQMAPAENARKQRLQQQLKSQAQRDDAMEVDGDEPSDVPDATKVDHATSSMGQLARLLFVLGHSAMKQLVYIDAVVRHVKARNEAKEKKSAAAAAAAANRRGRKSMGGQQDEEQEAIEKELGVGNADPEDDNQRKMAEDAVVWDNLLGSFGKVVVEVCSNRGRKFNDPFLRFAAVNALCKYMLVSESFCEENLQLLFSILSSNDAPTLRASIAISLGDLNVRFPNKIDEYRDYFYGTLRDTNVNVRKNTLLVLTHLILHDMIKPKENISAMAMCLEDTEQRISDLARLFFYELAAKENAAAIYNIIPGLISGLSQISNLPFESVQNIVRFLFSFIQKEKQLESLIDKLCQRFTHQEPKQYVFPG